MDLKMIKKILWKKYLLDTVSIFKTCNKFCFSFIILTTILLVSCTKVESVGGFETPIDQGNIDALIQADLEKLEVEETVPDLYYIPYRIKEGDFICNLAEKFGISEDSIVSVNGITNTRRLRPNSFLKIPSISGLLHVTMGNGETITGILENLKDENVSLEKCVALNKISADEPLKAGTAIFIPDAKLDWVTRQEINGDLFMRPLKDRYYISSWYGYRKSPFTGKRTFHSGIDMAASRGTKIYASLDGYVSTCGWSNVYGNYVIVTHHSGYKTLYAHMDSFHKLTKLNRKVTTNSVLGYVGSTGLSTGDHLHFTVYKNSRTVNPANLWN